MCERRPYAIFNKSYVFVPYGDFLIHASAANELKSNNKRIRPLWGFFNNKGDRCINKSRIVYSSPMGIF